MSNPFETSFIPQQPLLRVEGNSQRHEPVNVALVVSLVVFLIVAFVGGGLYYWKLQVVKQVNAKGLALKEAEKNFSIEDINYYKRLEVSLNMAKKLVDDHTIFSVAFDLIEERTAKNIGLTGLAYTRDDKGAIITLSGEAPSYAALYFQVDVWRKMAPVVTNVDLATFSLKENSGIVDFSTKITVTPGYFYHTAVISASQKKVEEVQPILGESSSSTESVFPNPPTP